MPRPVLHPLLAPRMWGLHLAVVVLTAAAVALGLWQYDAWRRGRHDEAATRSHAAPRPLDAVLGPDEAFPASGISQPVNLRGRWLPGSTVYVSGRVRDGLSGVWAVTPVAVCAPGDAAACRRASAVPVVRGWAPSPAAAPAPPHGAVRLRGWLEPGESSSASDPDPADDVVPQLRIGDLVQRTSHDLYGGYVLAQRSQPPAGEGLRPVAPARLPEPTVFTALRNLLYAVQWWVFGGFAVYVWLRWCRDELARTAQVPSNA